jgi:beta-N-acetylhexosaminidase
MGTIPAHRLSRREFLRWIGKGVTAAALTGCCATPRTHPTVDTAASATVPSIGPTAQPTETPTPTPDVSLEHKIGQMLMIGFRGLQVSKDHFIVRDIQERNLGGVVLFDYDVPSESPVRNIESPVQVETLVASLQAKADTPLLVAIDHEGGVLTRLKEAYGFPPTESHQALGELDDLDATRAQATAMARTLAELGINLNLAPVVDLNVNPDNPIIAKYERSFSADPETVTRHAQAFIEAHHAQGVNCTLKHFPGHGSSTGDTHEGWVDVTDTWSRAELEPYAAIIGAGLADAVMTAHVFNASLDADHPATLSYPTITTILREELGYDGVVISDDMQMGAIADHYGFETAVQMAIEAGVDILAFANNSVYEEDVATRAVAQIVRLVETGIIDEARIDASYRRIQRLKETM